MMFTALKQAVRWQVIPRNPVEAVDKLKEQPRDMQIWAPTEAARFLDSIRGHRLYAAFYLAMSTGLRRGEVLGLCWQEIKGNVLSVRRSVIESRGRILISTPKTSKGVRRVTLSPDVIDVLEQHRQRQEAEREFLGAAWPDRDLDFVFATELGTLIHPRNFERTWYGLQDKTRASWREELEKVEDAEGLAKLDSGELFPQVRFHDLRHLNVSIRRKQGQDAKLIADQIGHTDASFTMRYYGGIFEEDRMNSAVDLTKALGSTTPPEEQN
jgi:integrase